MRLKEKESWVRVSRRVAQLWHHRTLSEEFENVALLLRLGLPTTLIRHVSGAFLENAPQTSPFRSRFFGCHATLRRRLFPNWSNLYLKKPTFWVFCVDKKKSENGGFFENDDLSIIMM